MPNTAGKLQACHASADPAWGMPSDKAGAPLLGPGTLFNPPVLSGVYWEPFQEEGRLDTLHTSTHLDKGRPRKYTANLRRRDVLKWRRAILKQ